MTQWIGFSNIKDWFQDKQEFEQIKAVCRMFNAQWIEGVVTWGDCFGDGQIVEVITDY